MQSKSSHTSRSYKRNTCNTRAVQLTRRPKHKEFAEQFKVMGDEEKVDFWRSLAADGSPKSLDRLMDDVLTKVRSETKIARVGGGYYPPAILQEVRLGRVASDEVLY